ncbi:MAG TPA: FCD domain-containing protein [Candidatus Sumerlaeota bacterium]|nr:FCD domain-containing protein [Candidatus Sumerlaeota bacterium]
MMRSAQASAREPAAKPDASPNQEAAAYEQIFQWLEDYIDRNEVQLGDPLPSEDEIMRETQMSRSSVREAITRLRALGIVDTRRKRGMWLVRSPRLLDLIRLLSRPNIPPNFMGHAFGYRCALELGLCSEIFRRATPQDIAELRAIFEKMVEHGHQPKVWNDYDRQFHLKLIAITGNEIAIWMSQLLNPFFQTLSQYTTSLSDHVRALHESIVTSLEQRNAEAFYQAMHEHNYWKLAFDKLEWTSFTKSTP